MDMTLVTGGTGVLGAQVVRRLLNEGRSVRVLSRRPAPASKEMPWGRAREGQLEWAVGDLSAGTGLRAALDGVDTVLHCASEPNTAKNDPIAMRHLIDAARAAGSPHLVYVSIVGIDRVPYAYYRAKLEVEQLLEASDLPWTILRATQFHDLMLNFVQKICRLPVALVPTGLRIQPMDTGEAADRLVDLAAGRPSGRVSDIGGPRVWTLADMVRAVIEAGGRRRPVLQLPVPGKLVTSLRNGGLTAPDNAVGRITFEEFLATAPLDDPTYGAAQRVMQQVG